MKKSVSAQVKNRQRKLIPAGGGGTEYSGRRVYPLRLCCMMFAVLLLTVPAFLTAQDEGSGGSEDGGGTEDFPATEEGSGFPSEEEIFDASQFEEQVEEEVEQGEENTVEYLAGANVLFSSTVIIPTDFDFSYSFGAFAATPFVKVTIPDVNASVYLSYLLRHYIFQAASDVPFPIPAESLFENQYSLSEFYLSFDVEKAVFIRIGNQLLSWGAAYVWRPADFVNVERRDIRSDFDFRIGKPGIRLHFPFGWSNLFLFADFSDTVTGGRARDFWEQTNLAGRFDFTAYGFEYGLMSYLGADVQNRYGADISGNILGVDVYAESAFGFSSDDYDGFFQLATGFSEQLGEFDDWTVRSEFFYNSAGEMSRGTGFDNITTFAYLPLYSGKFYLYSAVDRQDLFADFLDTSVSTIVNFTDSSYSIRLSNSFDFPRIIPFSLYLTYAGGGDDVFLAGDDPVFSAGIQMQASF